MAHDTRPSSPDRARPRLPERVCAGCGGRFQPKRVYQDHCSRKCVGRNRRRRAEVQALWLQRPIERRTGNWVLVFYGELWHDRPELLPKCAGDPYQHLKSDLRGMVFEPYRAGLVAVDRN